jgi:hypothetical protein
MIFLNKIRSFLVEAKRRNPLLFYLAVVQTVLFLMFLATFWVCGSPPIAEICYWLKPFKFSLSFAIYVLTLGWLMEYLRSDIGEKKLRLVSIGIALMTIMDTVAMFLQSMQHSELYTYLQLSEKTTEFISEALRLISDTGIVVNSAIACCIAICFFRKNSLQPRTYLWGIRIGFAVFISSCLLGMFLLAYYDKMPPDHEHFGLPFTQLHSIRYNLISLHFFGIHAIQLFPLIGYYFKERLANFTMGLLTLGYVGGTLFFLSQLI